MPRRNTNVLLAVNNIAVVMFVLLSADCAPRAGATITNATEPRQQYPIQGSDALSILKAGNNRFSEGHATHPHTDARFRRQLENEQHPLATVLGCSDSRVPPELIFDEGFGDLFVVRVAGNIVDVDVSASVEYAVDHLRAPLLVVLGHEGCGAVTAAIEHLRGQLPNDKEPPEIFSLLSHIEPGIQRFGMQEDLRTVVHVAVEENVRHSMQELAKVPDIHKAIAAGALQLVGAIYDLHTGKVRYLEPTLL